MKYLTLTIIFLLLLLTSFSQTINYFPNFKRISIDTTYQVFFSYDITRVRLINKPCYELPEKDLFHCEQDPDWPLWRLVAKFNNELINDSLYIIYSEGLSADPGFVVVTNEDRIIGRFSCLEFFLDSAGTIFTSGHVNNMYNRRRKFQLQSDTVTEINQPFYYVGLKGKTLKDIILYQDKLGSRIVTNLPKGSQLEILLAESSIKDFDIDYCFLVRTDFGLVGWLILEGFADPVIDGLYYAGD